MDAENLKKVIEKADDDYLAGLGNKGILKRAYKDLEQESPVLTWKGPEAQVSLKEESCTIKAPLGESTCSCPSRSICRHIITAVLWMKREAAGRAGESSSSGESSCAEEPSSVGETSSAEEPSPVGESASARELSPAGESSSAKEPSPFEEILQIPAERLARACRGKHYREFLARIRQEGCPPVQEASIVTVEIPWEKAVVKLLEPFSYSSCSCHSRQLCIHKAQAVLIYQLCKGRVTLPELEKLKEQEHSLDEELVRRSCESICGDLCQQVCIGLSRQSQEEAESLERLSLIAHRASLPALERVLREASFCYQQYFSRSAAFRTKELLENLLSAYGKAKALTQAAGQEEMRLLAGNFRDTYVPAGVLHLTGMGGRSFTSKNGYEGEIYYFLERVQRKWYTWTDARPVLYESVRSKRPAEAERMQAPWGLNCSREKMQEVEFDLQNARAASGGRLSASKESRAEITGSSNMDREEIRQMIWWDYEELLRDCFDPGRKKADTKEEELLFPEEEGLQKRREKLVMAGACSWESASFDPVEQRFSWILYDGKGRELSVSLTYTKQEKLTIQLLERLEQRLRGQKGKAIVFFGSAYLERGRLCLYPIEFFFREAGEAVRNAPLGETKGADPDPEILDTMERYVAEAADGLRDLFVSGLYSLQEETLLQLRQLSEEGESLGLHGAGEKFARLCSLLQNQRHQMTFSPEPVLEEMAALEAYLEACQEKISYDRCL